MTIVQQNIATQSTINFEKQKNEFDFFFDLASSTDQHLISPYPLANCDWSELWPQLTVIYQSNGVRILNHKIGTLLNAGIPK